MFYIRYPNFCYLVDIDGFPVIHLIVKSKSVPLITTLGGCIIGKLMSGPLKTLEGGRIIGKSISGPLLTIVEGRTGGKINIWLIT